MRHFLVSQGWLKIKIRAEALLRGHRSWVRCAHSVSSSLLLERGIAQHQTDQPVSEMHSAADTCQKISYDSGGIWAGKLPSSTFTDLSYRQLKHFLCKELPVCWISSLNSQWGKKRKSSSCLPQSKFWEVNFFLFWRKKHPEITHPRCPQPSLSVWAGESPAQREHHCTPPWLKPELQGTDHG